MCYIVTLWKGAILKSAEFLLLLTYFHFFTSNMTYYHENRMLGILSVVILTKTTYLCYFRLM